MLNRLDCGHLMIYCRVQVGVVVITSSLARNMQFVNHTMNLKDSKSTLDQLTGWCCRQRSTIWPNVDLVPLHRMTSPGFLYFIWFWCMMFWCKYLLMWYVNILTHCILSMHMANPCCWNDICVQIKLCVRVNLWLPHQGLQIGLECICSNSKKYVTNLVWPIR